MVEHPAGYAPLLAHCAQRALWPSSHSAPWASGKSIGFGAACPMAHTFACLRIADHISEIVARLATGSGGLTLGRAGFAPAGRQTKFHEGIVSSLPFDQHCLVALNFLSAADGRRAGDPGGFRLGQRLWLHNGAVTPPICRSPFSERLFSTTHQSRKTPHF